MAWPSVHHHVCNHLTLSVYCIKSILFCLQSAVIINTIWTFGANSFLQSVIPGASRCNLHLHSAMCSSNLFWGCSYSLSWRSCSGLSASLRCLHTELKTHPHLTCGICCDPPRCTRTLAWTSRSYQSPTESFPQQTPKPPHQLPPSDPQWGENSSNQMALSKNTSPAKPNQAMCLFTFPAMAI